LCKILLDKIAGVWYNGKFGPRGACAGRSLLKGVTRFTQNPLCFFDFAIGLWTLNAQIDFSIGRVVNIKIV
jgi:hypothetical protein